MHRAPHVSRTRKERRKRKKKKRKARGENKRFSCSGGLHSVQRVRLVLPLSLSLSLPLCVMFVAQKPFSYPFFLLLLLLFGNVRQGYRPKLTANKVNFVLQKVTLAPILQVEREGRESRRRTAAGWEKKNCLCR